MNKGAAAALDGEEGRRSREGGCDSRVRRIRRTATTASTAFLGWFLLPITFFPEFLIGEGFPLVRAQNLETARLLVENLLSAKLTLKPNSVQFLRAFNI